MLFNLANLPYWIFLGIGIVLFLTVIVTGGTNDDFDVDGDLDIDIGFDFLEVLGWLGIGKAPLILLLGINFSTWGVLGWMFNMTVVNVTGNIPQGFLAGFILLISLVISLIVVSIFANPLGKIFAPFGEDVSSDRLIGCLGTVTSKQLPYFTEGKIGQADVLDSFNNLVTVEVSLPHWAQVIPLRGQQILIIEYHQEAYLAIAKDSTDEDYWLRANK